MASPTPKRWLPLEANPDVMNQVSIPFHPSFIFITLQLISFINNVSMMHGIIRIVNLIYIPR